MLATGLFGRINFPNDYITGERIKRSCNVILETGYNPSHLRMVCQAKTVFIKTDFIERAFEAMDKYRTKPCSIVTHNSDFKITERLWVKKPEWVLKWYAVNIQTAQKELIPIPFGTENSKSPGYSGDMGIIERILNTRTRSFKNLAYINFNPKTNIDEREAVIDLFANKSWATHRPYGQPFNETMHETRAHKFVFAPPGNGICTHRMWESIYLGSIPIVKRGPQTEAFTDLPILIVDSWSQITKELLEETWNKYSGKEWNMEKATLPYWRHRINTWDGEISKDYKRI